LLDKLNMRRIAAKFVPRLLTDDQKQHRLEVRMKLKEQVRNDPDFLSKVVTCDECWIYGYDPETKHQSSQWKCPSSPLPMKAQQVKSNVKSMPICFFDIDGLIHKQFVSPGQTINAKIYCDVLRWLWEDMRWKRPDKVRTNNWMLHHDNTPTHTTLVVQQFLASKNMTVVPRPPYLPVTSSSSIMKMKLKGRSFDTAEEIKAESQKVLKMLTQKDFEDSF
jgi:histone-lysine N-methyltransferase SETMAR